MLKILRYAQDDIEKIYHSECNEESFVLNRLTAFLMCDLGAIFSWLKILRCAQDGIEGICYSERIEDLFYQIYLNEVNNGNVFFFIKILHGTRKYIGNKYAQLFLHLPATYD